MGIYVWGTGCGASELMEKGLALSHIAAFIDSFPSGDTFLGKPVLLPEQLPREDCELLIVTTRHGDAVAERCASLGIPGETLLFLKNNCYLTDRNACCTAAEVLLGRDLLDRLFPRQHVVAAPAGLSHACLQPEDQKNDYVRMATLELLSGRLRDVPGAAAELGVYKGFFARCIQQLLPERALYLFDSFQGFSPDAGAGEAFQAAHQNTTMAQVLSVLPNPQKAVLMPGFFPASLHGLEERFCLVSLDVDFAETTLEGLRYFYPRLEKGGYILLHDWGNPKLPGVAHALSQYEQEMGCAIPAVPICDVCGTLVLCKPH